MSKLSHIPPPLKKRKVLRSLPAEAAAELELTHTTDVRTAIAQGVHHTVVAMGGAQHAPRLCEVYAGLGAVVATTLLGRPYWLQAGKLSLWYDPDDPCACLELNPFNRHQSLRRGEFHCWGVTPPASEVFGDEVAYMDLAARHYRFYVEQMRTITPEGRCVPSHTLGIRWKQPEPPEALWVTQTQLPPWVQFLPLPEVTKEVWRDFFLEPADRQATAHAIRTATICASVALGYSEAEIRRAAEHAIDTYAQWCATIEKALHTATMRVYA